MCGGWRVTEVRSSLYRYCVCKDSGFLTGSCMGAENQDRGSAGGNNTRDERDATDLKGDNRKGKREIELGNIHL